MQMSERFASFVRWFPSLPHGVRSVLPRASAVAAVALLGAVHASAQSHLVTWGEMIADSRLEAGSDYVPWT